MRSLFLTCLLAVVAMTAYTQTKELNGKIVDSANGEPLAGAVLALPADSIILAVANRQGEFRLETPPDSAVVYFLGYERAVVKLKNSGYQVIALQANPFQVGEIVVNAYRWPTKLLRVPGDVSIVTRLDLKRDNEVSIAPVLNRVPGVYMHSGALNTNRITIRGIGTRTPYATNKIRAFLDDIPLTSGDGETTIEDIDLSMIKRVDVIKGPSSSLYGAGLGGTINLISAVPGHDNTSLEAATEAGSYGLWRHVLKIGHTHEQGAVGLLANTTRSAGYRENNEYERSSVMAVGRFNGKGRLSFLAGYIRLKAFIPSSLDSATYVANPRAAAASWKNARGFEDYGKALFGLGYSADLARHTGLQLSLFSKFKNAYERAPFGIFAEESQAVGARGGLVFRQLFGWRALTFQLGGEYFSDWFAIRKYRRNDLQPGEILADNNEHRQYFNIYAQADLALGERTSLTAGINLNKTRFALADRYLADSIDQSGDYQFELIPSPRLAVNHIFANRISLFASVAHGFSTPTLEETLTPDGLVNTEIRPETGFSYEAGSRGYLFGRKLYYDVTLYSMHISNLLVARRTGLDEYVGVNAGKTVHNGISLGLQYQLLNTAAVSASSFFNYSLAAYYFKDFVDDEKGDFSGNQLTGVPPHVVNAGVDLQSRPGIYAHINYQYVSAMPITDANSVYSDSYSLVNLRAGIKKSIGIFSAELYAGINNLFNVKYASMILINARSFGGRPPRYYYPGLPVNYFGGLVIACNIR